MKQENENKSKIDYVKPEIIDLGSVTAAFGGSCGAGGAYSSGTCSDGASPKNEVCFVNGVSANGTCNYGTDQFAT